MLFLFVKVQKLSQHVTFLLKFKKTVPQARSQANLTLVSPQVNTELGKATVLYFEPYKCNELQRILKLGCLIQMVDFKLLTLILFNDACVSDVLLLSLAMLFVCTLYVLLLCLAMFVFLFICCAQVSLAKMNLISVRLPD